MHTAVSVLKDDDFIEIEHAYKILNIPSYGAALRFGQVYTQESIFRAIKKLNGFIDQALHSGKSIVSLMEELPYYYDAIDALNKLDQRRTLVDNIYKRAAKINKAFGSPYSSLWYDKAYKAWNVLTQLQDLFGTDPLSFDSLEDKIFDKSRGTGLFEPHHIDRTMKESLALYDQILTDNRYNPTYDTMSMAQQKILKEGVRKLVQMGIKGQGSAKGGYINADDIRKVFAGQTFDVKSRKTNKKEYSIPILSDKGKSWQINRKKTGLWDYHFSDSSFRKKLSSLNSKIERYRDTFTQTNSKKEAYLSVLSFKYNIALTRFKNDASRFVTHMFEPSMLQLSPLYPLNFGNKRHLTLTKILF